MRQHDGGFLSQPGAQRRNEVNPAGTSTGPYRHETA